MTDVTQSQLREEYKADRTFYEAEKKFYEREAVAEYERQNPLSFGEWVEVGSEYADYVGPVVAEEGDAYWMGDD